MHDPNESITWDTYMYLLCDAADRLQGALDVAKAAGNKTLPWGTIVNVQRQLTVIGDELSRLSTRDVQPPIEG